MPRRPNIEVSLKLNLALPESERGWLDAYLYSEAEQRVPRGAYQQFFLDRLREFRERMTANVHPRAIPRTSGTEAEGTEWDLYEGGYAPVRGDQQDEP